MTLPERIDAVIFDMDGTLLDTEALYKDVLFGVCAELGHVMTEDIHRAMVGNPREHNRALLQREFGAAFDLEAYVERTRAGFLARLGAGVPLKQGARDLLGLLRELGIPCAVATSSYREDALRNLEKAGLLEFFATVVGRDDVTRAKPDPEPFLLAAERMGVDPAHCLAIEDSHNGVRAAHAAGMHTIMVPDMLAATEEMERLSRLVLDELGALAAMIRALRKAPSSPA
jgi:HAD superfamily hydrolase (TIGR01509 family)